MTAALVRAMSSQKTCPNWREIVPVSTKVVFGPTPRYFKELQNLRSYYDSYDAGHMRVMNLNVCNAFLVTPLMEYWFFRDRIFLSNVNI